MYLIEDKNGAIILMVISLWCLGSWPVFFNILERRGRLPQHSYLDYALSAFIVANVFAFTVGEIGGDLSNSANFINQLLQIQTNILSAVVAMAGGVALCLGNIAMQYSLAFLGVSLAEVVSASIAVVGGTTINYFLDNGLNRAQILFPGVGCFLFAVILGSFCHASNAADITRKLNMSGTEKLTDTEESSYWYPNKQDSGLSMDNKLLTENESCDFGKVNGESDNTEESFSFRDIIPDIQLEGVNHAAGSAEFLLHVERMRAIKVSQSSATLGLAIAFVAGFCYAMFSPLFNIAANDQFRFLKPGVTHLSVYTSFFYFSTSFLILAVMINIYFLYHPILGLPRSSISAYISDHKGRGFAVAAGLVCGLGNGFQFMGGQAAGYAAADAVQALPLVGTFWGVVLFGEYHRSSKKTYMLLSGMLMMFVIAVGTLIASSQERY